MTRATPACEIVPYVVGQFYRVPVVRGDFYGRVSDWPVLGTKHEDAEFINFPDQHYHLDARFIPQCEWKRMGVNQRTGAHEVFIMVLQDREAYRSGNTILEPALPLQPLGLKRMKCKREWPAYPGTAPWRKTLDAAYAEARIGPGLICPHRGAPLQGLMPDAEGCVTCPLHGLRWNCKTGRLQP